MRYILSTNDTEGIIGIQISKWAKEKKLEIIEKADLVVELQAQLERTASALAILKKAGYNSEVMRVWIHHTSKLSLRDVDAVLQGQAQFFKAIGVSR